MYKRFYQLTRHLFPLAQIFSQLTCQFVTITQKNSQLTCKNSLIHKYFSKEIMRFSLLHFFPANPAASFSCTSFTPSCIHVLPTNKAYFSCIYFLTKAPHSPWWTYLENTFSTWRVPYFGGQFSQFWTRKIWLPSNNCLKIVLRKIFIISSTHVYVFKYSINFLFVV